jgi:serine/threonine-protein kinase
MGMPEKRELSARRQALTSEFEKRGTPPFQLPKPDDKVSVMNTEFRRSAREAFCLIVAGGLALATWVPVAHGKSEKKTVPNYGAIAFHQDSGSKGFSFNQRSAREASVEALKQCGHDNCEVILSIRNACGALASSKKGFASSTGATRAEAETKALKKCGPGCDPVIWTCTR